MPIMRRDRGALGDDEVQPLLALAQLGGELEQEVDPGAVDVGRRDEVDDERLAAVREQAAQPCAEVADVGGVDLALDRRDRDVAFAGPR